MYLSWLVMEEKRMYHQSNSKCEVWIIPCHSTLSRRGRGVWISRHGQSGRAHGLGSFMSLDGIADDALGVLKRGIRARRFWMFWWFGNVSDVNCSFQVSAFCQVFWHFDALKISIGKFWIFSVHSNWPGIDTQDNFSLGREYCSITIYGTKAHRLKSVLRLAERYPSMCVVSFSEVSRTRLRIAFWTR